MIDITVKNIEKKFFTEKILEDVSLELKSGERVGLLGENGTGKTTIFKIIMGIETIDAGQVFIRKNIKIGILWQMPLDYGSLTVEAVLLNAFKDVESIKKKLKNIEKEMEDKGQLDDVLLKKYGELQTKYEVLGGYDVEEKMSKICSGLGFSEELLKREYYKLSGGEKSRVELGKILLEEPEVLLLDEPTNHLDIETTEWLENYISNFKGGVLIISHDRYFLDKVVTKIFEIKNKKIEIYHGNYSDYINEREIRHENMLKMYNQQKRKIKQLEAAAKRFREWGSRADNEDMFVKAKAVERRIEKMDKIDKPILDTKSISVDFKKEERSGKDVLRIKDYNLSIENKILVNNIELKIIYGERAVLLGGNGTGKSTLIKEIIKSNLNENDYIKVGSRVKIGYMEQDIKFSENKQSIIDTLRKSHPMPEGDARGYLAKFKFFSDDVFKNVDKLSGGEKVRLKLAILMKEDINFLILDEPTNHIDIKTREILEDALKEFRGSLLFISHDRFFINKLANKIIEIENKEIKIYKGNYQYYQNQKIKERDIKETISQKNIKKPIVKNINKSKPNNKFKKKFLEEEIEQIEKQLELLQEEIKVNQSNYQNLVGLVQEEKSLELKLEQKMDEWIEIE